MKKQILEEIKDMRYLLNYNRGKVISEQINEEEDFIDIDDFELYDPEEDDLDPETDWSQLEEDMDFEDMELDEEMDLPVMLPGTKEKERTITTPGIKPGTKPGTPYSPKPGPKKNPKARKGDMPEWLSFDELGIDFE